MVMMPKNPNRWILVAAAVACSACAAEMPAEPDRTEVTITEGAYGEQVAHPAPSAAPVEAKAGELVEAVAITPAPNPYGDLAKPLFDATAAEGPLPVPTTIAATKSALFVFGR